MLPSKRHRAHSRLLRLRGECTGVLDGTLNEVLRVVVIQRIPPFPENDRRALRLPVLGLPCGQSSASPARAIPHRSWRSCSSGSSQTPADLPEAPHCNRATAHGSFEARPDSPDSSDCHVRHTAANSFRTWRRSHATGNGSSSRAPYFAHTTDPGDVRQSPSPRAGLSMSPASLVSFPQVPIGHRCRHQPFRGPIHVLHVIVFEEFHASTHSPKIDRNVENA